MLFSKLHFKGEIVPKPINEYLIINIINLKNNCTLVCTEIGNPYRLGNAFISGNGKYNYRAQKPEALDPPIYKFE